MLLECIHCSVSTTHRYYSLLLLAYTSYPIMINSYDTLMSIAPPSHHFIPRKLTQDTHSQTSTEGDECDLNLPKHPTCTPHPLPSKHKTSLCKNFTEKGSCSYGTRCQFAHGPQELRINMQDNRCYKTKGCYAFSKKGFCYYGERCNFIHQHEPSGLSDSQKWAAIYRNHGETMREVRRGKQSRLMGLLREGGMGS